MAFAKDGGIAALEAFEKGKPYPLDKLLVSNEPVPFEDFGDLDGLFGPLPPGFRYRYLAPPTHAAPEKTVNFANNVIRMPDADVSEIDAHMNRSGDEIPDHSLTEWLEFQSPELNRLWSLRILALLRILAPEEIEKASPQAPVDTRTTPDSPATVGDSASVAALVERFRDASVLHYDGEVAESDSETRGGISDKKAIFEEMRKIGHGAIMALAPLLDDEDIGVRVSAATYLLGVAPEPALRILDEIADTWPARNDERGTCAFRHAWQTFWMRYDGNLVIGCEPERAPAPARKPDLLDWDIAKLVAKFAENAMKNADAFLIDDFRMNHICVTRNTSIAATLEAREALPALAAHFTHPDPAVRCEAATRLRHALPIEARAVIDALRNPVDPADKRHPHWRQASMDAGTAIWMDERGEGGG